MKPLPPVTPTGADRANARRLDPASARTLALIQSGQRAHWSPGQATVADLIARGMVEALTTRQVAGGATTVLVEAPRLAVTPLGRRVLAALAEHDRLREIRP